MATGDLKGNLGKLEQGLRLINYSTEVDYTGLAKGDPSAFLPIISYCFTSFSTYIIELLVELDVELVGKDDLRFVEAVYKLLRDHFQYKPVLTKQQFLQYGFAERKMQIVCEIINMVYKKHKQLSNMDKMKFLARRKTHAVKHEPQAESSHLDFESTDATNFQQDVIEYFPDDAAKDVFEECHEDAGISRQKQKVLKENNDQIKEIRCELAGLQEKVNKMHLMEEKLYTLEEKLVGKVIVDEQDWDDLICRVVLLESQLSLQPKKDDLPTEFNTTEESTSSVHVTPVSPDEEKAELPVSLDHSSEYSSLISSSSSTQAMGVNNDDLSAISESQDTTAQRMERISKMFEETSELLKTSSDTA